MRPAAVHRHMPQRYRLEAAKCANCGKVHFPPRLICNGCRTREFEQVTIARRGRVVSWTVVRVPAPQFEDQAPYPVAVVELDDGVRITCEIADAFPDEVRTGMRVRLEFRRIQTDGNAGVIAYGHKAAPE